jgi:hypothetical protein
MHTEESDLPLQKVLQAFNDARIRYLVIGGQAAIIYGASQFTRDADFWIEPTARNVKALRKALANLKAKPRFLPPLNLPVLKKGHGVHFIIPQAGGEYYIDLLGKPPRVSSFTTAYKDARTVRWHGLRIRVLDIPRLVATKKTNRDQDYTSIQLLAGQVFEAVKAGAKRQSSVVRWLVQESRIPAHLLAIAQKWKGGREMALKSGREAAFLAARNVVESAIQAALDREKAVLQSANLAYWRPFIKELRAMGRGRKGGKRQ